MARKTIYLAGGCFWGAEAFLKKLPGVVATQVGYANATMPSPTYEQVCGGTTNAAETVACTYDSSVIPLSLLLEGFFRTIDPTSVNRQGADVGTQYRTGIWWEDEGDAAVVKGALESLQERVGSPLAVEQGRLVCFYPAEEYHQDYLDKNVGGYCHVDLGEAERFAAEHHGEFGHAGL